MIPKNNGKGYIVFMGKKRPWSCRGTLRKCFNRLDPDQCNSRDFFFHLLEIDFFSCTISQLWFPLPLLFPVLQFSSTSPPILIHPLSVSQIVQTMIHRSLEFLSSSNYLYFIHATSFVMCFIVSDCQEVHCNTELTLLKKARSYTNALQNRNETLSKN